ncbi:MAG: alpha/beta hydrolase [Gammaproteobacteria bacterium]|nr:alpha/beta hydrolase [Gammaproteobacteria bacterium]
MIRLSLAWVDKVSPALAAQWVYRMWFRTQQYPVPKRELKWAQQAHYYELQSDYGALAIYSWGEGPTVLLVHGWSGRAVQLGAFAQPLVDAGFRVVAFDAPAHGKSPGKQTTIFQIIEAMNLVANDTGPVHAIISHSFGAMVIARALATGLSTEKVVCISPPAHTDFLIESFCQTLKVPEATKIRFVKKIEKRFGDDVRSLISAEFNARTLSVPALIIHDRNDKEVPWQQGERLARAWPGSRLALTEGLGHRRILRNQAVVKMAVDFIR